jgi:hypothetical protein
MGTYSDMIVDFNKKVFVDENLFDYNYIESKRAVGKHTLYVNGNERNPKYAVEYYVSMSDYNVKCAIPLDFYSVDTVQDSNFLVFQPSIPIKNEHLMIFDLINQHRNLFKDMFIVESIIDKKQDYMASLLKNHCYLKMHSINNVINYEIISFRRDVLSYDKAFIEYERNYRPISIFFNNGIFSGELIDRCSKNLEDKYGIVVEDFNNLDHIQELFSMVKL